MLRGQRADLGTKRLVGASAPGVCRQHDHFLIRVLLEGKRGPAAEQGDEQFEDRRQRLDRGLFPQHLPDGELHQFHR